MSIERGRLGPLPYAALGDGPPLAVLAGLSPTTGFEGDTMVRATAGPFAALPRRLFLFNRRPGLPRGMTMADLAAEHAEALRAIGAGPVDLVGTSTGGSIAQQLAADHPEAVGRLGLVSTGCRLEGDAKDMQRRVAARIRAGADGQALAVLAASIVPPGRGRLAAGLAGRLLGRRLIRDDLADMATTLEAEDDFDLARCPPIRAPTLILAGAEDRFYPRELLARTAALIPGAVLRVFPGRGHITVMRDPGFRPALTEFLG